MPAILNSRNEFRLDKWIALLATLGIALHLLLRFSLPTETLFASVPMMNWPLLVVLVLGGVPLMWELAGKLFHGEFGSDLLAGLSIATSIVLGEYLAGSLVVLMLSGGEALESFAVQSASSVLSALARRLPKVAHRQVDGQLEDIAIDRVEVGDLLTILPHEVCPVDGTVISGNGSMDESFLTGEPYLMPKSSGSNVISGAINGNDALVIRAEKLAVDSRYAQIMHVMQAAEEHRPRMRRLGDALGAIYTPVAILLALFAWWFSGNVTRFLAVLVVATPCPLLIAIPVAIIGSISLAARRGIIIRDPSVLERIATCRVAIFDKTGTLTYGRPALTEIIPGEGITTDTALKLIGSLERYSKHPLATAITSLARERQLSWENVSEIHEPPGQGLSGIVAGRPVQVTSRGKLPVVLSPTVLSGVLAQLPSQQPGMECIAIIDGRIPVTCRFRDQPRPESAAFIRHLPTKHQIHRVMIISGDRETEVRHLADMVGIDEVYFSQSPEQKLERIRNETRNANTVFVGDGINDAPALTSATVGIALGGETDITSEAADAVILNSSISQVDELLHIGLHMRRIALQSALGGMLLSVAGMVFAAFGLLSPVGGAIAQEVIDLLAVMNALRAAQRPRYLIDFQTEDAPHASDPPLVPSQPLTGVTSDA